MDGLEFFVLGKWVFFIRFRLFSLVVPSYRVDQFESAGYITALACLVVRISVFSSQRG